MMGKWCREEEEETDCVPLFSAWQLQGALYDPSMRPIKQVYLSDEGFKGWLNCISFPGGPEKAKKLSRGR